MSSIKDEEFLITFQELRHLEVDEISTCIDKYEALSICEKSTADSIEIFNVWVQKLFKAYDISEFKKCDWLQILGFLEKILDKFIQDLSTINDDKLLKQLNLWWTDTLELLKWMESIINKIEVQILASVLNFVLDVIIKTCRATDKRDIKCVIGLQQKILIFLTNYVLKTDIQNAEDFNVCNKVLLSLCDVAAIISSADIKISIETWRATAKLTNKCNDFYKQLDKSNGASINELNKDCSEKPIRGILNELKKLFQHFLEHEASLNNDNFLKVAQFYLKLFKIIMQNSNDSTFSAAKEYFELYSLCMHQLRKKNERKVIDFLQKDLYDNMHIIYDRTDIVEFLCGHLINDNKICESCDLIIDYMQFYLAHDDDGTHLLSAATASRIFDIVFDGHLIFADNGKYSKIVFYYVALTAQDVTSELHMKWCNNVLQCSWIKAYVSYDILRLFYSQYFKANNEQTLACLEFWIQCWQKFNATSIILSTLGHHKILIEMILYFIVTAKLPQNAVEQICNKFQYSEILLLKCGQNNFKLHSYLNNNLSKYLLKIQQMQLQRTEYIELLNLLDIWCRYPQFVNFIVVKMDLVKAFLKLFSITSTELNKFKKFFNRFFFILKMLKTNEIDNTTILKCLQYEIDKTTAISSVYMLEYILECFSQNQIKCLLTPELQKLQTFLRDIESNVLDFKSLNSIYGKAINSNQNFALNVSKRPRLGNDCKSSNCKIILNEMLDYSRQLSNGAVTFDSHDCELLNIIKQNIQKCLLK